MDNALKAKIGRMRMPSLIAAWKLINSYGWPKGWPSKQSVGVNAGDEYDVMREIAAEIGQRVINGRIPTMEELLEQGESYHLSPMGRLSMSRQKATSIPDEPLRWFIYWGGVEIHFKANPDAPTKGFDTVREAMAYLRTKSAFDVLVKIGAEKPAGGKDER